MNPADDQQFGRVGAPSTDHSRGSVTAPQRQQTTSRQAAANLIRSQIDHIYSGGSGEDTPQTTPTPTTASATPQPEPTPASPETSPPTGHGLRTAPPSTTAETTVQPAVTRPIATPISQQHTSVSAADWDQYHSAWQKYYQMYYERYYVNHLHAKQQELSATVGTAAAAVTNQDLSLSHDDAMKELRSSIRQKVRESTKKVQKSRHFVPIIAGLIVLLLFLFLQYNRIIFGVVAAYTTPGSIEPQNIIVDPSVTVNVTPEPRLIIPKINVDVPVVYGIGPDYDSQMKAMESGVAHFSIPRANAVPGQIGNTVLAGHSSNDVFARGDYKFIFAQNEKLTKGDVIYANYEGQRYTYEVTSMEVVMPDEVSRVQVDTTKPMLTLVSCVPLGTAEKRLLVFAEQISPSPDATKTAHSEAGAPQAANIPGKPAPTLLERLFGAN